MSKGQAEQVDVDLEVWLSGGLGNLGRCLGFWTSFLFHDNQPLFLACARVFTKILPITSGDDRHN